MHHGTHMRLIAIMIAASVSGAVAGCSLEKQEAPTFTGPSGFALSAPRADFTFSPAAPVIGETVAFDASATLNDGTACGDACTYTWNFGDSSSGSGRTVTHGFTSEGTRKVRLTATNPAGSTSSATRDVTVTQRTAPTAKFSFSPTDPTTLETVNFTAAESTAAAARTITNSQWNFGDGSTATGATASHRFNAPGTFAVVLTVTDSAGLTATTSEDVKVIQGTAPTAKFTFSPASPEIFETVNFTAEESTVGQAGRTITSYEWRFDDGSTATGVRATHSYSTAAKFTVVLTVTDSAGLQGATTKDVTVANSVTASFTISPTGPTINQTVILNAEASKGSAGFGGRNQITKYIWNFGSSTATREEDDPITSTSYSVAGTYTINLTVEDSAGRRATTSKTVAVE